jgi:hypothetical protein
VRRLRTKDQQYVQVEEESFSGTEAGGKLFKVIARSTQHWGGRISGSYSGLPAGGGP